MAEYFDTTQMSSALASLTARLSGKAGEVGLYPMLKKATSSSEQPTPGYIYQVLVEFSFESPASSRHLAQYLNTRLQRPSAHGVLKTLKTMKQLVEKGSREFRRALRENEEHIKNAPDYGSQQGCYTGTEVLEQIRNLSVDVLQLLFDQASVEMDGRKELEVRPVQSSAMAGMGRSMSGSQGRMEGFGSEPVDRSSVIDRARDMLESVVNLPDPKKQIMELCLKDDVGSYEAAQLPGLPEVEGRRVGGGLPGATGLPRLHTPGRAGGGWEDSSDEEQDRIEQLTGSLGTSDTTADSLLVETPEYKRIQDFCQDSGTEDVVERREDTVMSLLDGDALGGLCSLMEVLDSGAPAVQLRGLLLLEFLITQGVPSPSTVATAYSRVSSKLQESEDTVVAVKAKKIHMILDILKDMKPGIEGN